MRGSMDTPHPSTDTRRAGAPVPAWRDRRAWRRIGFMALFVFAYGVAETALAAVVLGQIGFHLLGGAPNPRLQALGGALARYLYQILRYLTYSSEQRPFPFAPWPEAEAAERAD